MTFKKTMATSSKLSKKSAPSYQVRLVQRHTHSIFMTSTRWELSDISYFLFESIGRVYNKFRNLVVITWTNEKK